MSTDRKAPDPRVEVELVRALYRQGPLASFIALVMGAVMAAAIWGDVPAVWVAIWYALITANQAVRIALWRAFHRANPGPESVAAWARRYTAGMAVGGGLFGSAAWALPYLPGTEQAFLLVFISGMAAGSVSANAFHRPAMVVYLAAILATPTAVVTYLAMTERTMGYVLVAFAYVFYFLVMQGFGRSQARVLRQSIEFSHRNDDLVAALENKTALAESAKRAAERASAAKSLFFAAASHDLRQPLHALGLFAASLRTGTSDPQQTRRVDQILSSVDALESLFDELLDISKLDAGAVKVTRGHFHVESVYSRLATVHAPAAAKAGLGLRFMPTEAVVETDAVLLERLLGNLVSNAIRYTQRGGVFVGCRRRGTAWSVEVWDTGVGIPEAERERVFDEFYQLNNPERDRRKGLGLGLATVKRIAAVLGHEVELDSRPGHGSVFRVRVPAGDAARIPTSIAAPRAEALDSLAGKTVAVVEDDAIVREGMRELLGEWRCLVVDGASAADVAAALSRVPDLIVADYRLREGRNGVQAVAELRAAFGAGVPAVLISGDTAPDIFAAAQGAGLVLLQKPVQPARLRATLTRLLARGRAAREEAVGLG
jgi:signal transduction histidine kinase